LVAAVHSVAAAWYTTGVTEGTTVSEVVTLELPTELVRQARALAAATNRRFEDAVAEWIGRAVAEPPVESLTDADLLAVCDSRLPESAQEELSDLLARNREGGLVPADRGRLDDPLAAYRRGLALKARAVKEAVTRGLKPRLGDHAA
jgi:hypothetical protein